MENVGIFEKKYSDGSKAWFLIFFNNEAEVYKSLRITKKQFIELKKAKFPILLES